MKAGTDDAALTAMATRAEGAARLLGTLAHTQRLLALCRLLQGECPVGQLAELVGLSPSALSQHLARLRDLGLVATRRQGRVIFYHLASAELAAILATLHGLYCAPLATGSAASGSARSSRASSAPRL